METHGPDLWLFPSTASGDRHRTGFLELDNDTERGGQEPPSGTPRSGKQPPVDSLKSNLRLSAGLHLALAIVIILRSLVFPGEPKKYRPALRVDLVGLPEILKKDMSQISPALPPAEAAPEEESAKTPPAQSPKVAEEAMPDEMVLKKKTAISERNRKRLQEMAREQEADKKRELKNQAALSRLKSLAKIRSQLSEKNQQQAGVLIKGNQISKGTSLSGDASEKAELSYYDLVRDKLQQAWELPVWLARQNLSAKVEISIDARGIVRSLRFTKPSGNPQFDEAVRRTIAQAQPFPRPPKDEEASVLDHGISLGFPL